MSDEEHDALHEAFEHVFLDLCTHGICRYDPFVLDRLWYTFLRDLAEGFPSLMGNRK